MSGEGTAPETGSENGMDTQAGRIQVVGQYIKDLSFENPAAPGNLTTRPQIDLNVDLQARQLEREHYEVELRLRVSATCEDKPAFLLELVYAGLFQLQNIPEEVRNQILLIEAPHILFPFARRIVADMVRDGGMPPLMIEPIDFAALYRAKAAEMQQARTANPGQLDA
ncbi:MAG TPA: protein-export chaperone SecB [Rhizomicrobium sp.]